MLKWLKYLGLLPQLVGFVLGVLRLVREAEDLLAGGALGAEKRATVLDLVDTALTLGAMIEGRKVDPADHAQVREITGLVVDQLVAVLNALGIFKHAPAAAE